MPSPREIRQRLEKITPGEWFCRINGRTASVLLAADGSAIALLQQVQKPQVPLNADFIAHAPTDIAALLERVEQAEKVLRHLMTLAAWDDFATDDGSEHPVVAEARQFLNPKAQEGRE